MNECDHSDDEYCVLCVPIPRMRSEVNTNPTNPQTYADRYAAGKAANEYASYERTQR